MQTFRDNWLTIVFLFLLGGFFVLYGVMSYLEPDFEEYTVKIVYCDKRPTEVKTITVSSGLPPRLITYKQAVPILCFCDRGINSYEITNVCDFEILSKRYLPD